MTDTFLLDARHVMRALARSPMFVFVAVLSTGAGIGVNTAVFSWLDSLVLHPFPAVTQPERVVGLETLSPGGVESPLPYSVIRDWRTEARTLSAVAAWTITRVAGRVEGDAHAAPLVAMAVSGSYFGVLGVGASLGRTLMDADERERAPVVVLGHGFWLRQYGADPRSLGRTLFLNGLPFTVVGVAPPKFAGTYLGVVPDVFVPVTLQPAITGQNVLDDRRARAFQAVARLAPGVTRADSQRELDAVARRLSEAAGDRPVTSAVVKDIRTQYLGGLVLPILAATLVVTATLLLVGCANVASLLLVRATSRGPELALRVALGAPPARVARLVLLEAAVLALAGGAVGIAMAYLARGTLSSLFPTGAFPLSLSIELNVRVLLFALGSVIVVVILCSWLPAARAARSSPGSALRAGRQSYSRAGTRARSSIVSLQLGFSLLSVVTAALFVRALQRSASVDIGFSDPKSVLLVGTDLAAARLDDTGAVTALRQLLARTRALPGVVSATAATVVPLGLGGVRTVDVRIDGFTPAPDESMSAVRALVGSDYARTMGIRVLSGRDLGDADRLGATPVALVNETMARRFWPNESALGRRVDAGRGWATVVGVVASGKYGTLMEAPQLAVYLPLAQWPQRTITLHVRTSNDPLAMVPSVRGVLSGVHPDLPALQPRTLLTHIGGATFIPRVGVRVLGAFATTVLALAAFGLYGALAVAVATRSRELAIRTALGAGRGAILWSVGGQAARITVVGIALGTGLAVLAARALRPRPLDVGAIDAATYFGGLSALVAAVALAAWLPARRAMRVDPLVVLRGD
jgi:predicted permease